MAIKNISSLQLVTDKPTIIRHLSSLLQVVSRCIAIFLIAVVANYYLLVALVVVFVSFLTIRWYYLKTARDVKRLEALGNILYIIMIHWYLSLYSS